MKRSLLGSLAASAVFAALLLAGPTSAQAQKKGSKPPPPPPPPPVVYPYKFTNLGQPVYGNSNTKAYCISNPDDFGVSLILGGGIATPSPSFATMWEATAGGALLSANAVPDSAMGRAAVNDAGVIAFYGHSESRNANTGMVYVPGVGTVEFPRLDYFPQAVNNLGQVVLANFHLGSSGYLWAVNRDGTTSDPVLLRDFVPRDINDWGVMVGIQLSTSAAAIAWFEEGVLKVQSLPGLFPYKQGQATGINNFGEVVGLSGPPPYTGGLPFLWSPVDGLVALNPKTEPGAALDINDRGQVVGWSINAKYYAFLWEKGKFSNLNDLNSASTATFQLSTAQAINDAGQIVGRSSTYVTSKGGSTLTGNASFLLTPNP